MLKKPTQKLAAHIKKETNAASVILITCDSLLPCPDMLAHGKCEHPHQTNLEVEGMSIEDAIDLLETNVETLKQMQ